tara:strand:- start:674 stop:904 length:231 start_codon:yes stop_codon:yes gene_type:complete
MGDFKIYEITINGSDEWEHFLNDRDNKKRMLAKVMMIKAVSKGIALQNYKKYIVDSIGLNINDDVLTIQEHSTTKY